MLIIPIEQKPDWKRPPIATLVIIAINLLVFTLYQSNDSHTANAATQLYIDKGLLEKEQHLLLELSQTQAMPWVGEAINALPDPEAKKALAMFAFYQRDLDTLVRRDWSREIHQDLEWKNAREKFEIHREDYSSLAYGLTPAEAKPLTYLTSIFLHGGWDHLIGNMVFLFLFGFLLELVLGAATYLVIYLITGVIAGAFFTLFNPGSVIPLVGASGAISGLMGAYIVMYGLRKIRFFYTIGIYFGEFKAPALAILPLWLAKEMWGHFNAEDNVAYLAHFGGLIGGAACLAAYQFFRREKTAEAIQEISDTNENTVHSEKALEEASKLAEKLDLAGAKNRLSQFLQQHPTEMTVWDALLRFEAKTPEQRAFHQTTFNFFKAVIAQPTPFAKQSDKVRTLIALYVGSTSKAHAFNNSIVTCKIICFLFAAKQEELAAQLLAEHFSSIKPSNPAKSACLMAAEFFHKKNAQRKAEFYRQKAAKLSPPAPAA